MMRTSHARNVSQAACGKPHALRAGGPGRERCPAILLRAATLRNLEADPASRTTRMRLLGFRRLDGSPVLWRGRAAAGVAQAHGAAAGRAICPHIDRGSGNLFAQWGKKA